MFPFLLYRRVKYLMYINIDIARLDKIRSQATNMSLSEHFRDRALAVWTSVSATGALPLVHSDVYRLC